MSCSPNQCLRLRRCSQLSSKELIVKPNIIRRQPTCPAHLPSPLATLVIEDSSSSLRLPHSSHPLAPLSLHFKTARRQPSFPLTLPTCPTCLGQQSWRSPAHLPHLPCPFVVPHALGLWPTCPAHLLAHASRLLVVSPLARQLVDKDCWFPVAHHQ